MIYEYQCQSCKHVQEVWQKMSDPGPDKCEKCGAEKPERVISKTSFALKGSGWYTTDYKRSAPNPSSDSGGKSGAGESDAASGCAANAPNAAPCGAAACGVSSVPQA
jgi:putative FmdB family regulatory protein